MGAIELSRAFGFLGEDEVGYLKELAKYLDPNPVIVNIGSGTGTSVLALLESRGDARLYNVDIECGVSPFGGLGNAEVALRDADMWGKFSYYPVCGDSKVVGNTWTNGIVDFVFIDGDHSRAGCEGDIRAWYPRLIFERDGRKKILALHDFSSEFWPDVINAVDEVIVKEYRLKLIDKVDTVIAFWAEAYRED